MHLGSLSPSPHTQPPGQQPSKGSKAHGKCWNTLPSHSFSPVDMVDGAHLARVATRCGGEGRRSREQGCFAGAAGENLSQCQLSGAQGRPHSVPGVSCFIFPFYFMGEPSGPSRVLCLEAWLDSPGKGQPAGMGKFHRGPRLEAPWGTGLAFLLRLQVYLV